ncbi:Transposase Tc1-like [Trinorchestia longiramus]|nr:Transposase Tc1-like [Trinorchestia longiramus]
MPNTTLSKPRTGHPRKINDRAARKLVRTVAQRPQTTREELKDGLKAPGIEASKRTISRALAVKGAGTYRVEVRVELETEHFLLVHMVFEFHPVRSQNCWFLVSSVLMSAMKPKSNYLGETNHVWRQQNEEHKPKCTIPTVNFEGGSIMVWGCFSSSGVGKLHIIEGTMNDKKYVTISTSKFFTNPSLKCKSRKLSRDAP